MIRFYTEVGFKQKDGFSDYPCTRSGKALTILERPASLSSFGFNHGLHLDISGYKDIKTIFSLSISILWLILREGWHLLYGW